MRISSRINCIKGEAFKSAINRAVQGNFITILDKSFPKAYDPSAVEKGLYDFWEQNGCFTSKTKTEDKFSMVFPPPNVTGTLHLGHSITAAIQDAIIRWQRMEGKDVVWVPGLDHAGIATQTVLERWLKKKTNKSRHDLGREEFLKQLLNWRVDKGNAINQQLKKLGASLDWSKEIFTMDDRHSAAVKEAVIKLWDEGLIYRKESLVNWSCQLSSTISDIEVDKVEVTGPTPLTLPGYEQPVVFGELTEFAYRVCDSDEDVVVSTTRPETMLGDVAVAVHPDDTRFSHLHNCRLWHPFRNTSIPLICDSMVDMKFGTGAVKITPGHSQVDWEVAQRHNLPMLSVFDEQGYIIAVEETKMFEGIKRFDARGKVKNELAKLGLLKTTKPHNMIVPVCSRSGDVVEYLLKDQWFISCKEMARKASAAVREGRLQIEPDSFLTVWFNWLDNIRDWCISRQLWWGHQIPLYLATKNTSSVWVAALSAQEASIKASSQLGVQPDSVTQDPDVLDTWFSSALYPLSSLGWPKESDDFHQYYPLDLMETGHDILFFWVARMVMLGEQLTGQLPFKKVSLHGIICDAQGRKMSKSLGNVISPEDVIDGISLEGLNQRVVDSHKSGIISEKEMGVALEGQKKLFPNGIPKCGTDALRFTLLSHNTKSHFISFDVKECEVNHHFCNKIWQATKFSLFWSSQLQVRNCNTPHSPGLMDKWILSQLNKTVKTVTSALETADLYLATAALKDFLYFTFCDIYVETTKPVLRTGSELEAVNTCQTLLHCLETSFCLASPVMPFISEQLYKHLPGNENKSVMLTKFPSKEQFQRWENAEIDTTVEFGIAVLGAIRSMKSTHGFYKKQIPVEVETNRIKAVEMMKDVIELLANCTITISNRTNEERNETLTNTLGDHTLIHISLESISEEQFKEYINNLTKKESKLQKTIVKLVERTQKKNYHKNVDVETQSKDLEQIKTLEEELRLLRSFKNIKRHNSANKPSQHCY